MVFFDAYGNEERTMVSNWFVMVGACNGLGLCVPIRMNLWVHEKVLFVKGEKCPQECGVCLWNSIEEMDDIELWNSVLRYQCCWESFVMRCILHNNLHWKWNLRNPIFKLDMEHHFQEMVLGYMVTTKVLLWKTITGFYMFCGVDDVTTYQSTCIVVQRRLRIPENPPHIWLKQ